VLIEAIHKMKQEKIREKQLAEQREARRQKNTVRKVKRVNKKLEQMGLLKKVESKDVAPVKEEKEVPKKEAPQKSPPKKDQAAKQA
jgi:hypothetical protein